MAACFPPAQLRAAATLPPPKLGLAAWATRYLPAYFTSPPSLFHEWLIPELASLHATRGQHLSAVGPRGSAKSTWVSFAYPLHCALHGLEPYILLLSDTNEQAAKYLDAIKLELEDNPGLARDYPGACGRGPVWQHRQIRLRNGVLIEALGTGAKIRGRKNRSARPSLVIGDDLQNDDHMVSALQRQRCWEWWTRGVMSVGDERTNFFQVGTALHRECIAVRLHSTPGWRSRVFKALLSMPTRMDLWAAWEELLHADDPNREAAARVFYGRNQAAMDAGAELNWPGRETLYDLMLLRASMGVAAFESEKQSNPVDPGACEWPADYFDWPGFRVDRFPEGLPVEVLALDPSKGRDARRGDYSAFVRVGRSASGVYYAEADLARRDTTTIAADGAAHVKRRGVAAFGVEANAMQELLLPDFEAAGEAAGVFLPLYAIDNTLHKPTRIRSLTPLLAQRRLRLVGRSPGTQLLADQLRDFPNADHDDGPDALEMGVRLIDHLLAGRDAAPGVRVWRP